MSDPLKTLEAMLHNAAAASPVFPASSRYHQLETTVATTADGRLIVHLKRRFVPLPERFAMLQEHAVTAGDRLDLLAAKYLGDPGLFWRLCDANGALRPDELIEELGRRLRVTLPENIPGGSGA
jgi:hypothetical protein